LRVKVLQSLYAYFQSGNNDLSSGEKELFHGIEKIFDLYLFQFSMLAEVHAQEAKNIEDNRNKFVPTPEDLNPNKRLVENRVLRIISESKELASLCKRRKISWENHQDIVRKLLAYLKQQNYYKSYMDNDSVGFEEDREFVLRLVKKNLFNFELLHSFYEENSIYWIDDWELVSMMVIKTIKGIEADEGLALMELYKDQDDKVFARELFLRTILNHKEMDDAISAKTKNWDLERIALMDIIIMKMALTEILKFDNIPVKVSLNEYIELSKMYSTPKSNTFINGVLDKLVDEFTATNQINKHVKGI